MRAIAVLALPLVLNSTVQAVLNLTDTWFIGRLSTSATAAIAAVHWLALLAIFMIGGVAMGVQTLVAQAYGAGRYRRTSQIAWLGLWAVRADDSRIRADGRLRAGDDPRLRARAGRRGARDRFLDSAHDRRAARGGAVGGRRLLQWHRPHAHPARHRSRRPRLERDPERDLHLSIRHGHGGRRLGDDSRRADRRRARDSDDPAPRARALLAAADLAAESAPARRRSLRSACRWR